MVEFQNVNPERGRKLIDVVTEIPEKTDISEREPRKGTETTR